jgi:hypothetical protein
MPPRPQVAFIKQEALEKAREIKVKADEEFAIEKVGLLTGCPEPGMRCARQPGRTRAGLSACDAALVHATGEDR